MTTFSQMVDSMMQETKRLDLRTEIISYLNQTIREVHFEPSRGSVVHYYENRRETQLIASGQGALTWQTPHPANFQGMELVRFDSQFGRDGRATYAELVNPGPMMELKDYAYYRAGNTFVFGGRIGYGGAGARISLSWFEYPRGLAYYPVGKRPCTWTSEYGFDYHEDVVASADDRIQAEIMCTNWLLLRWSTVLEEGLRAKIYKRLSDDSRARTSYSSYQQLRQGLFTSESADVGGIH